MQVCVCVHVNICTCQMPQADSTRATRSERGTIFRQSHTDARLPAPRPVLGGGGGQGCVAEEEENVLSAPLPQKSLSADNYFAKCNKHPKNSKQLIRYPRLLLWLRARI